MRQFLLGSSLCLALLASAACQLNDESDPGTDLVIRNSGSVDIESVTVNGVGVGSLPAGGVITMEDIGPGSFYLQAFQNAGDSEPCSAAETPVLSRGETGQHTFDCSQ